MTAAHPLSLCVFCGSSRGDDFYGEATQDLSMRLAEANVSVIYGGGNIGLMGVLADSTLKHKGRITGVIPQFLVDLEVAHHGLTELVIVSSMHERKAEMAKRADAFVALPGGFGTMEEFFEVLTWLQLGLHSKPCIILNFDGFYTPLLKFLRSSNPAGFISSHSMDLISVCETVDELMHLLRSLPHTDRFREDRT